MQAFVRSAHKYISLAIALIWIVQAVTGLLMVFHREIESLAFDRPEAPADFQAIGRAIDALERDNPGARIPFVYTAGKDTSRLDVYVVDEEGDYRVLRMDGDGTILRDLPSNPERLDAGFFEIVLTVHKSLLFGDWGHIFIGVSGLVLLTNLALGLTLAWPRRGQWRRSLKAPKLRRSKAAFYNIHRTLGLWFVVPAMILITAGTMIVWSDYFAPALPAPEVAPGADEQAAISTADAITTAMRAYPGARFSAVSMPAADAPYYKVRLVQEAELREIFGMTTIYVDARNGAILANYDALDASASAALWNAFYPIHTGAALGLAGRIVVFLAGLWLVAMIVLGVTLWVMRNSRTRGAQ